METDQHKWYQQSDVVLKIPSLPQVIIGCWDDRGGGSDGSACKGGDRGSSSTKGDVGSACIGQGCWSVETTAGATCDEEHKWHDIDMDGASDADWTGGWIVALVEGVGSISSKFEKTKEAWLAGGEIPL